MATEKDYLGTAIAYPLQLVGGKPVLVSGKAVVEQSIATLLSTTEGNQLLLPQLRSRMNDVAFEQNDEVLESLLRMFIHETIGKWEKRVKFKDVSFERDNDAVLCKITYVILQSNEVNSFIYPYYSELKY